jgi:phosphoglucomutase
MIAKAPHIREVPCRPFLDQRPGTAGLRKKVSVFIQANYLECFIQAILSTIDLPAAGRLVVGGDGRFFNDEAIQIIIRMCAAHGVGHLIVGRNGILSTPAASNLIRQRRAHGGFILTASHNPGGPDGDFGVKFNTATGGQAPEALAAAVFEASKRLSAYRIADLPDVDLTRTGTQSLGPLTLEVVDATQDYLRLMQQLFDFDAMAAMLAGGARLQFDALHGVTGPYALRILCDELGASRDSILHAESLPDFGGLHPDPNPTDAAVLVEKVFGAAPPDLAAASDGDGDRNMILGPRFILSPGDSIAVMLAHADKLPGYRDGIPGVARSMPTSRAVDRVAEHLGIPCYETPTGWRYFCNLLEAGLIGLCGEESFGTGSAHAREKDGLWAVLFWLNLLAILERPLPDIVREHWLRFGRNYFQRHDFFVADADRADDLMAALRSSLGALAGKRVGGTMIKLADDFVYRDPVDHSESRHQGIRIWCDDGSRIVYRLSGTGTSGATLRVYLEKLEQASDRTELPIDEVLGPVAECARETARIRHFIGLDSPTLVI